MPATNSTSVCAPSAITAWVKTVLIILWVTGSARLPWMSLSVLLAQCGSLFRAEQRNVISLEKTCIRSCNSSSPLWPSSCNPCPHENARGFRTGGTTSAYLPHSACLDAVLHARRATTKRVFIPTRIKAITSSMWTIMSRCLLQEVKLSRKVLSDKSWYSLLLVSAFHTVG